MPGKSSKIRKHLLGSWIHSHEEDTADTQVFRRSTFDFPPSRGRVGYEFRADRTYSQSKIAARDGSRKEDGEWDLQSGPDPVVEIKGPGGEVQRLKVASVDTERLVVKKV